MKKTKRFFLVILALFLMTSVSSVAESFSDNDLLQNDIHLHVFYGQGCPHCAKLQLFLEDINANYPTLIVHNHEVYHDDESRLLFEEMASNFGTKISGVPTIFIGDKVIVGFSNNLALAIEEHIMFCSSNDCGDAIERLPSKSEEIIGDSSPSEDIGEVVAISNKLTIPLVMFAAAVDAINPCAFAVLIILMTAALSIANKKRALKFGLAFTVSIYLSYFLMGLGLFSALQATGLSHGFYVFVTILAVIVGLLNIKDYFWYGKGFLMEVPLSWRPAMKKLLRSATSPLGAFLVGFVVSLFELPCTGGPYIVILGLLAKEVTRNVGIFYLLLYNLVFVSPLIVLSLIIYKGLSSTDKLESIRQEKIRLLHLIAGIIMLGIATVMIFSLSYGWV